MERGDLNFGVSFLLNFVEFKNQNDMAFIFVCKKTGRRGRDASAPPGVDLSSSVCGPS